jgi:hypothetical protein
LSPARWKSMASMALLTPSARAQLHEIWLVALAMVLVVGIRHHACSGRSVYTYA